MCFDVENERIRKIFQACSTRDFFIITQKESISWEFFLDVNFKEYFKCQPT
jgi:hypothetical protein